jgi:hypothetical protein
MEIFVAFNATDERSTAVRQAMDMELLPEVYDVSSGVTARGLRQGEGLMVFPDQAQEAAGQRREAAYSHPDLLFKISSVGTILSGQIHCSPSRYKRSQPFSTV